MGWRLARERRAMPSAWFAEAMQAQGHAQGRAGVRAHADVRRPGRPAECRPVGVQLGRLAEWAAMRQHFMVRSGRWSLRTHLPWLAAMQVLEVPASPPRWGSSMMTRTSLAKLSAHEGTESMNRQRATRATVDGRQPDKPAAMSLRCGCCQSHTRPRKWPGGVAERLYVGRVTTAVVSRAARRDAHIPPQPGRPPKARTQPVPALRWCTRYATRLCADR